MDKIMNYIVFLCFLYLIYISFKRNRSLFVPSNFFILVWFSNYFVLMFFVHDFYLHYIGSAFILLMAVLVYMGSYIGMEIKIKRDEVNKTNQIERSKNIITSKHHIEYILSNLRLISILFSLAGLCVVPMMMASIKGDFWSLFNFKYVRHISVYVSMLRYREAFQFPLTVQMFLGLNYFASLINGVYFGYLYDKKKARYFYLYFIPILTSICISIITTEKALILFTALLFSSGFMVAYNALSKQEFKISVKKSMLFTSLFIFMMLIFAFVQMSRYGNNDVDGFKDALGKLKVYAFGHISAFSIWLSEYMKAYEPLGFGRYTFAGIFSFLNIYERKPGIFTDFSVVSPKPLFSNVYTAYRGLIVDFSIIGSIVLIFLFSMLAGLAYKSYKESIFAFIFLILFYCITVLSLFTSLLNYNTLIASFVLLFMTFMYYQLVYRVNQKSN